MIPLLLRSAATIPRVVYAALKKILPVKHNKVLLLSRLSDDLPLDFRLIITELESRGQSFEIRTICRRYEGSLPGAIGFFLPSVRALFHLATAKVCVLDSYWPHISMLRHRPELTVFQLWHSLGKVKRSGYQTLDQPQGRDRLVSNTIHLHRGYDYVIAGAPIWNPYYMESFGLESSESILNVGLPRSDFLREEREALAKRIHAAYPEFEDRKVVLYAPTFRRKSLEDDPAHDLVAALDPTEYILVVKDHLNGRMEIPEAGVYECPEFSSMELLTVTDFLVTDYSAIAVEAAIIDVKTLYYVYDLPYYKQTNGLNIDLEKEMPGCVFESAEDLVNALDKSHLDDALQAYKTKFTLPEGERSTPRLVDEIITRGELCRR